MQEEADTKGYGYTLQQVSKGVQEVDTKVWKVM